MSKLEFVLQVMVNRVETGRDPLSVSGLSRVELEAIERAIMVYEAVELRLLQSSQHEVASHQDL